MKNKIDDEYAEALAELNNASKALFDISSTYKKRESEARDRVLRLEKERRIYEFETKVKGKLFCNEFEIQGVHPFGGNQYGPGDTRVIKLARPLSYPYPSQYGSCKADSIVIMIFIPKGGEERLESYRREMESIRVDLFTREDEGISNVNPSSYYRPISDEELDVISKNLKTILNIKI